MLIIGYIAFIIITITTCIGAAIAGTYTGLKENEINNSPR